MTEFVIVVEVDNKRARAAYAKGMADLDLIWPQLMASAERIDDVRRTAAEERKAKRKAEAEKYKREVAEWENACSWLRGEKPSMPLSLYYGQYPADYFDWHHTTQRQVYESIRDELRQKFNLADCATQAFRMTEDQVTEMVKWENGTRIDALKNRAGL